MKSTARINDWIDCGSFLIGKVVEHTRQKFFGLNMQQTSTIVARPKEPLAEGMHIETLYTNYILGPQFVVANEEDLTNINYGGTDD